MSGKIYDILMCSKMDLKHLVQVQKYLENSAKRKTMNALTVETIKKISTILSEIYSLHHPESEYLEILIDTLLSAVRNKDNEFGRIESERGNLTLKTLQCIEHDANFHILLCKLLSLINLMCSHSIKVWQLLARPVLNLFINKKFEHVHMEKALKEFINISKNSKLPELVRVIKQNRDIPKLLSMLVRGYGDFIVQMNVLELLVLLKGYDKSLVKTVFGCWNTETSELLDYLTFSNFKKDSRIFLNAFNRSLGLGRKVFSLNCSSFYFGNSKLSPLPSVEGIWIDLNQDSKRICIFCTGLQLNPTADHSDILQIPVKEVERIKLKFYTISGEDCYCIYMRIRNTSEIDHSKESSEVICKALVPVNQRREVVDFVKAMEEISDKILWYRKMKTNEIPSSGDSLSQNSRAGRLKSPLGEPKNNPVNVLVTSPLPSGSKQNNDNKQSLGLSQTSYTSSVFSQEKELGSEEKCGGGSGTNWRNQFQEKGNNLDKVLENQNLQASQISSSVLESQILTIDPGLNSSVSSHISAGKEVMPDKWVFSKNIQVDLSRSEVGIRIGLLPKNQDTSGTSIYKNMMIGSNSNSTKNFEESNQIKRSHSHRMYEEWTNSVDDAIFADDLRIRESNKENISETLNVSVVPGKKCDYRMRKLSPTQQNKKLNRKEREKKVILKTSLLDPNGYCYKRWQSQTTSERSNFWLNKLKETEIKTKTKTSQPVKDIFHFSEEEDDYEESNAFKTKTQTAKKTCMSKDRENEIQKPGSQMKGDKVPSNCHRKTPIKECKCHHEVLANRESKAGRTLVKMSPGTGQISAADGFAEKRDHRFEELRRNLFPKSFSSLYDGLLFVERSDAMPKNDERIRTEENIPADGEGFLSSANKRKDSREMNEVCDLKVKCLKSEKVCPGSLRKQENAKRKILRSI